jgi:hypothetical protein
MGHNDEAPAAGQTDDGHPILERGMEQVIDRHGAKVAEYRDGLKANHHNGRNPEQSIRSAAAYRR